MKADESVKEKAMLKLKEVKAKSEDSGSKARQYLEGLLRIPFGIYREEPILKVLWDNRQIYSMDLYQKLTKQSSLLLTSPIKSHIPVSK